MIFDNKKGKFQEKHKEGYVAYPLGLKSEAQAIQKMREHFGIVDIELIPLEELRKSMARHGIRAEDNEFSRAIIEERGK